MPSIALVTVYHFNSGHGEAYARLIRGLRSSARQLVDKDRLILVANGVDDGAEDPDQVLKDVDASHTERIVPVIISNNVRAAGGLNVGVAEALLHQCDWIGQVQSSVVIGSRWLEAMRVQANSSMVHGLGGRLVCEEQTDLIDLPPVSWTPGYATAALASNSAGE